MRFHNNLMWAGKERCVTWSVKTRFIRNVSFVFSKMCLAFSISGSDVVDWLFHHVEGFSDRREARKYASNLLKAGYIRHTVNKITFSEQCYYVFGDLCGSKRMQLFLCVCVVIFASTRETSANSPTSTKQHVIYGDGGKDSQHTQWESKSNCWVFFF